MVEKLKQRVQHVNNRLVREANLEVRLSMMSLMSVGLCMYAQRVHVQT